MSLLSELNRRNVTRVAGAYLAVSWLVVQVAQPFSRCTTSAAALFAR